MNADPGQQQADDLRERARTRTPDESLDPGDVGEQRPADDEVPEERYWTE